MSKFSEHVKTIVEIIHEALEEIDPVASISAHIGYDYTRPTLKLLPTVVQLIDQAELCAQDATGLALSIRSTCHGSDSKLDELASALFREVEEYRRVLNEKNDDVIEEIADDDLVAWRVN